MNNRKLIRLPGATLACMVLLGGQAAWAGSEKFSLASGFDHSTGTYATATSTDILSIPVIGKYASGPWIFKLSAPFNRISGRGNLAPGVGSISADVPSSATPSDMLDAIAAATYSLYEETASSLSVDFTGKVKLALSDSNLGSGANDYAAQMDIYQSLDKFTAIGSLGTKFSASSGGLTLDTVLYGSFGGVYQFTQRASGGVDMSLAQRPSTSTAGQQEITAYVSYKIDNHLKAQGYLLKGFTSGGPKNGVGAQVSYGF